MHAVNAIDKYIGRQVFIITCVATTILALLVLVTQSIRLLDVVLQSGASAVAYFGILSLSLPRLVEVVLPAGFFIALVFVYRRLIQDSEMHVMRSAGLSNLQLARPTLALAGLFMIVSLILSMWVSPWTVARLERKRADIATQYAQLLFREGTFNTVGLGLTAYVRERTNDGKLAGLLVHDTRDAKQTSTIYARLGQIVTTAKGQSILVYDGNRQVQSKLNGHLSTLSFERYAIELPTPEQRDPNRWQEPEERTLGGLLSPLPSDTPEQRLELTSELHRRLAAPFLMLSFAGLGACFLLLPAFSRREGRWPLIGAGLTALTVQGMFFSAYQTFRADPSLSFTGYAAAILPACLSIGLLYWRDHKGD